MLQQTTVQAVAPRYAAFLARFPTLHALAAAPVEDVLAAWAGLGYYSRARNLHACARAVMERHGGRFPADVAGLRTLPGIGDYTAGAIGAIAFGLPAVAMDGNAERVIARLFAVETPLLQAKPALKAHCETLLPATAPGDFVQALMDLGSGICTPRAPSCLMCPLSGLCEGRAKGIAETLPRKAAKADTPLRTGVAFIALAEGHVLLRRRPMQGLLGGMREPPQSSWEAAPPADALSAAPFAAAWARVPGIVTHTFTHFRLEVVVYRTALQNIQPVAGAEWIALDALDGAALPTVMRKMIRQGMAADAALSPPPQAPRAPAGGTSRSVRAARRGGRTRTPSH